MPTSGKPHALNAGIAATDGDLIGLIDDDEEVDASWFESIWRHFASGEQDVDFIGGKCLPLWGAPRPEWLGTGYLGVIGWVDPGEEPRVMDAAYPGILMGGNAVIRRTALVRAGKYSTALNRSGATLLGCEDEDMYHRLLALGARGRYVPDLVIYHHVPRERLAKRYFRRWCFWRGVSLGMMDRGRPAPVRYIAGVPRYLVGRAVRGLAYLLSHPFGARRADDSARRFESELACWDLAGFAWGRHVRRAPTGSLSGPASFRSRSQSRASRMSRVPDVSIVLPTYNRAADLPRAVESALNQTTPPDTYELVVVDNNSTDDTAQVVDRLAAPVPGPGFHDQGVAAGCRACAERGHCQSPSRHRRVLR